MLCCGDHFFGALNSSNLHRSLKEGMEMMQPYLEVRGADDLVVTLHSRLWPSSWPCRLVIPTIL